MLNMVNQVALELLSNAVYLFFKSVEIVNDDTNKQVQGKEWSNKDKNQEKDIGNERIFKVWLHVYSHWINSIVHYFHPTFKCRLWCLELLTFLANYIWFGQFYT